MKDFNRDEKGPVTVPKTCVNRHNAVIHLLRNRLEKPWTTLPRLCLHYPNFSALRVCDKEKNAGLDPNRPSWSVLKRICAIFKLPAVSCSEQVESTKENVGNKARLKTLEDEVLEYIAAETGRDRITRAMSNRVTESSPPEEFVLVSRVTENIFLMLFLFKFFKTGLSEGDAFLVRNRPTLYGTKSLANRRLANAMIGKGLKEGLKFAAKGSLAGATAMTIWRGLCVYYDTSAPWTFAVAGGTVLSLLKTSMGPKGMVGGFIFGSLFGGVGGMILYLFLKKTGMTQQEITYRQVEQLLYEKRSFRQDTVFNLDEEDEKVD